MSSPTINLGPAPWMDGPTFDALILRTFDIGAGWFNTGPPSQVHQGVIPGSGELVVTPGSGMTVDVAAGNCLIANSSGSTQGGYLVSMLTSGTLTVAAADPTNPRIDLVCATVVDNGDNTSYTMIQIITGTPAPSPAAPAPPANTLSLYEVTVPAGSTTISGGNIASFVNWTATAGGILPVYGLTGGALPAGYQGAYAHDRQSGRLVHNTPSGAAQPHLLPFAPVTAARTTSQNVLTSGESTVLSETITTDGQTDLEITLTWAGVLSADGAGVESRVEMQIYIDSTLTYQAWIDCPSGDSNTRTGGSIFYVTGGPLANTPSAASHTIAWKALGSAYNSAIYASSISPMILRIKPVCK